jgi:hypothetical protein
LLILYEAWETYSIGRHSIEHKNCKISNLGMTSCRKWPPSGVPGTYMRSIFSSFKDQC